MASVAALVLPWQSVVVATEVTRPTSLKCFCLVLYRNSVLSLLDFIGFFCLLSRVLEICLSKTTQKQKVLNGIFSPWLVQSVIPHFPDVCPPDPSRRPGPPRPGLLPPDVLDPFVAHQCLSAMLSDSVVWQSCSFPSLLSGPELSDQRLQGQLGHSSRPSV